MIAPIAEPTHDRGRLLQRPDWLLRGEGAALLATGIFRLMERDTP